MGLPALWILMDQKGCRERERIASSVAGFLVMPGGRETPALPRGDDSRGQL